MINYYFKMRKSIRGLLLLVCFLLFANTKVFANLELVIQQQEQQEKMLKGKVTDGNGNPLPGVYVVIKGTKKGTQVDFEGNYNLLVKESDVLVFSYVGMQTQKIAVKDKQTLDVILQESLGALDDIVVVAYGTQDKENLATSSTTVKAEAIENRPVANLTQALQGLAPNLIITPNQNAGAEPGTGLSIQLRGYASINSGGGGSPLILIDGMEQDINTLDPNNIESVTVLEDVASSSIYGSRGSFGVVLIETKSGLEPQVTYTANFVATKFTKIPKTANSLEYARAHNEVHKNSGMGIWYTKKRFDLIKKNLNNPPIGTKEDDIFDGGNEIIDGFWVEGSSNSNPFKELYKDTGYRQQHNFTVSGSGKIGKAEGNEKQRKFSYSLAGGLYHQGGQMKVIDASYARKNVGLVVGLDPTQWLNIEVNTRYTRRDMILPSYNFNGGGGRHWAYGYIWGAPPVEPLYIQTKKGIQNYAHPFARFKDSNPDNTGIDYFSNVITATLEPIKNWKTFARIRSRMVFRKTTEYIGKITNNNRLDGENPQILPHFAGVVGRYTLDKSEDHYLSPQVYTQYEWEPEQHYLKVMAGFEQEQKRDNWSRVRRYKGVTNLVQSYRTGTGDTRADENKTEWRTRSAFGSLNYTFDKKYILNASYRYDGSSRFIKSQRFGGFFSWAVGYNLHNEAFVKPIFESAKIDFFKLKLSRGHIGNQNIGLYGYIERININQDLGWIQNNIRPLYTITPGLVNQEATWESVKDWNYGFELAALKKRLNVGLTYFIRNTENMLGPVEPLPSTLGANTPTANAASLSTKGWNVDLKWADKIGDFSYSARFLLSDAQSEITEYHNPKKILGNWYEGQKVGEIWGYETVGIMNAETAKKVEANSTAADTKGTLEFPNQNIWGTEWKEGDIRYKDLNGDGKITGGNNTAEIVIDDELKKRIKDQKLKVIYKDGKPILIKDKDGNSLNIGTGDRKIIGNNTPRYNYSADFNFSYKGLSLRMFFQGVGKRDLWVGDIGINSRWQGMMAANLDYYRAKDITIEGETYKANKDAFYAVPYFNSNRNKQLQTRYLQDASYLRLKNVTLSYAFDKDLLAKTKLFKKASIFLSAENLWTYTNLIDYLDPELTARSYGGPASAYPLQSTYSVGLNLTF